jgi:hypothetical protein
MHFLLKTTHEIALNHYNYPRLKPKTPDKTQNSVALSAPRANSLFSVHPQQPTLQNHFFHHKSHYR